MKKHDQIISLIWKQITPYLKWTHKFGIEVPKTVKEAFDLDHKNGNTFWASANTKEMKEVCIAFKSFLTAMLHLLGIRRSHVTWCFTSRWKTFRKKAQLIAGGLTYALVVEWIRGWNIN